MKTTTEPTPATFILGCTDKQKGKSCLYVFDTQEAANRELDWINRIDGLETHTLKTLFDLCGFYGVRARDKNVVVMLNDILMPILHNENQYTSALAALGRILLTVMQHNQNIIIISHKHDGIKIWRSILETVNYTYNFEALKTS